ncbi:hypothetical protein HanXRQr2_Chr13g0565961 [Helianthus annuus]|uniref:Uncharacterized protein n=1 Tax=Helianthus annuus TaxID=4232 RepID=A0A9K3ECV6_HELAN|nr:hypothetical protein HanXRQr2_Chr13g0565961 [Helianthus annuus]KAJ0496102.1 hypothetical protein HanHA89_Chr13g0495901 [Helianthus annuus]
MLENILPRATRGSLCKVSRGATGESQRAVKPYSLAPREGVHVSCNVARQWYSAEKCDFNLVREKTWIIEYTAARGRFGGLLGDFFSSSSIFQATCSCLINFWQILKQQ